MASTNLRELLRSESLFDIFVAKQEYSGKRDKHGRFLYGFSNYKDMLRLIVSEYLMSKGFHVEWLESTSNS